MRWLVDRPVTSRGPAGDDAVPTARGCALRAASHWQGCHEISTRPGLVDVHARSISGRSTSQDATLPSGD
jgi:hypothetical protein